MIFLGICFVYNIQIVPTVLISVSKTVRCKKLRKVLVIKMNKHAYLIIAHRDFPVLQKLIESLDDKRNDIYVHIDGRTKILPTLLCRYSRLIFVPNDKRVKVYWGTVSQIKVELVLFRIAYLHGRYERYTLISGSHFPLKSQDEIHSYLDQFTGKEILSLMQCESKEVDFKLLHYHLFSQHLYSGRTFVRFACNIMWRAMLFLQYKFHCKRQTKRQYIKASNWVSLTQNAVGYLLKNEKEILKEYRFSFCGDEFFVPTELNALASCFKLAYCPRFLAVHFSGANAKELSIKDYKWLKHSGCLFARKFSSKDMVLINKIAHSINAMNL